MPISCAIPPLFQLGAAGRDVGAAREGRGPSRAAAAAGDEEIAATAARKVSRLEMWRCAFEMHEKSKKTMKNASFPAENHGFRAVWHAFGKGFKFVRALKLP